MTTLTASSTTAYLTQVRPNTRNRQVLGDLADGGALHKTLMRLLPDGLGEHARAAGGLLFRVDQTDDGTAILAQTRTRPRIENIPTAYGHTAVKDMSAFLDRLEAGMHVRYRIAANPVAQLGTYADRQRAQALRGLDRLPPARRVLTGPDADDWWTGRAARHGLDIHTILRSSSPAIHVTRHHGDHPTRHRHAITMFDGDATITDPDALRTAILTGIGRGRSFGAGLLSVAPA